jgi:hypothetical protein
MVGTSYHHLKYGSKSSDFMPIRGANFTLSFLISCQIFTYMYTVYVLLSKSTGKHYTGQTENFQMRFNAHITGLAHYTHGRGPWELVHCEEFQTRALAMARE